MAKSSMQKQKLLYLRKILLEKTDENHGMTVNEMISALNAYGIKAERKSIYDDLDILEKYGLDICRVRTDTVRYCVASRDFELAELKLLVDAIQSSKFITHKKSLTLIKKLERLLSENEGNQLQRQVYVANRVKTVNEKIYYNVDRLHTAISQDRQITFKYLKWSLAFGTEKKIIKTERRNGELYKVSPMALCWDDENYYLIAYDGEADMIKHYRVDKMENIEITSEKRLVCEKSEGLDIASYNKSVFSMFGGEMTKVKLSADNEMIGVIADRFGSDVFVEREDEGHFCVSVDVVLSRQFYAWLFGFGEKVKIVYPEYAASEFKKQLSAIEAVY